MIMEYVNIVNIVDVTSRAGEQNIKILVSIWEGGGARTSSIIIEISNFSQTERNFFEVSCII